ncbi:hypothetical protein BDZ97DRAFT_1926691 [Flammula alnicola]|nr:hypothetical protein BDZ97DRAFT_1926691 [Flammula alnicola]
MLAQVATHSGCDLDAISDAVDEVNVIKRKMCNDKSEFNEGEDKSIYRDYEAACDRVKAFYKEQHVSEWESYEEPFNNRFVTLTNDTMSRRRFMASDALPSHLPGNARPAEVKKIAKISSAFEEMLNKSGVIIPEHSEYHYLEMEAED